MATRPNFEEVVIIPPSKVELDALPLVTSVQYLEPQTSLALNRHNVGIVRNGFYRGFQCALAGGMSILIHHDGFDSGVARIERDGFQLTVIQQHQITVSIPTNPTEKQYYVVLEGFYQYGTVTKQVDFASTVDAASIKVIPVEEKLSHQQVIVKVTVPAGATSLLFDYLDYSERLAGGYDLEAHLNELDPHRQYFKKAGDKMTGAAELMDGSDTGFTPALRANKSSLVDVGGIFAGSGYGNGGLFFPNQVLPNPADAINDLAKWARIGTDNTRDLYYQNAANGEKYKVYHEGNFTTDGAVADAKAYADSLFERIMGGSPSTALDTIYELAEKLQDTSDVAVALTTQIAQKVSKSGDTMSGVLSFSSAAGAAPLMLSRGSQVGVGFNYGGTTKYLGVSADGLLRFGTNVDHSKNGRVWHDGDKPTLATIGIVDASTSQKGIVQLSTAINSTSQTLAATASAAKTAYDRGSLGVTNAATAKSAADAAKSAADAAQARADSAYNLANSKWTAVDATTSRKGIVQLSTSTTSTSTALAATSSAAKAAYDRGSLGVTNAATAQSRADSAYSLAGSKWTAVNASTTVRGIVQLSTSTSSTSTTVAATSSAAKSAYDRGSLGVTNAATAQSRADSAYSLANGKWTAVNGTTSAKGIVQLSTSTTSTSTTLAATPSAVKAAMDRANAAHSLASGITTDVPYFAMRSTTLYDTGGSGGGGAVTESKFKLDSLSASSPAIGSVFSNASTGTSNVRILSTGRYKIEVSGYIQAKASSAVKTGYVRIAKVGGSYYEQTKIYMETAKPHAIAMTWCGEVTANTDVELQLSLITSSDVSEASIETRVTTVITKLS